MSGDRWDRIQELFHAALESDAERRRVLEEAAAIDPELARELETLLAADSRADRFLEEPPRELMPLFGAPAPELATGARVGAYAIVREVGRGGMGSVYLAERADGQFEQRVAIKLLRHGMDTADILRRFRAERQILANLEHPHIARLLDGGMSEDGRPYLVMEYIEGLPIDLYCDRHRLPIDRRIDLFRKVCSAVQHAHRNLVVHRDLKPGNILVTPDGVPKLLDFGIAKLLDPTRTGRPSAHTRTGLHLMSPEYASPEQVTGAPVTTATDIYALGIVLYLLLTGHHPHHPEEGRPATDPSLRELERRVCEMEPVRPSAVVTHSVLRTTAGPERREMTADELCAHRASRPDRLRRRLAGDLDNIALMALRKEPDRRYASVEQLSLDLERHLSGQPVSARSDTLGYRAAKFARRNRTAVTAAALVVASLVGGIAAAGWQARHAMEERDRATSEAEKAQAVSSFLVDLFQASNPNRTGGDSVTAREILDRGAERLERELADQPDVQAAMFHVLGSAYLGLGRYSRAESLLVRAIGIRETLFGPNDSTVAQSLLELARTHRAARRDATAESLFHRVLEIRTELLGPADPRTASVLTGLAAALRDAGQIDSAEALARRAVEIFRERPPPDPTTEISALGALAFTLRARDDLEEAEALYREVLDRQRALDRPDSIGLAGTLNNLGYLLREKEEYARAEPYYREAYAILRKFYGPGHPRSLMVANNLSAVLLYQEKYDQAERVRRENLDAVLDAWPATHWRVGAAHESLGRTRLLSGRMEAARPALNEAVAIYTDGLGAGHPWTARARSYLATALALTGETGRADSLFELSRAQLDSVNQGRGLDIMERDALAVLMRHLSRFGLNHQADRFATLHRRSSDAP